MIREPRSGGGRREDGIGFVAEAPIPLQVNEKIVGDRQCQEGAGLAPGMSRDSGSWERWSQCQLFHRDAVAEP